MSSDNSKWNNSKKKKLSNHSALVVLRLTLRIKLLTFKVWNWQKYQFLKLHKSPVSVPWFTLWILSSFSRLSVRLCCDRSMEWSSHLLLLVFRASGIPCSLCDALTVTHFNIRALSCTQTVDFTLSADFLSHSVTAWRAFLTYDECKTFICFLAIDWRLARALKSCEKISFDLIVSHTLFNAIFKQLIEVFWCFWIFSNFNFKAFCLDCFLKSFQGLKFTYF